MTTVPFTSTTSNAKCDVTWLSCTTPLSHNGQVTHAIALYYFESDPAVTEPMTQINNVGFLRFLLTRNYFKVDSLASKSLVSY